MISLTEFFLGNFYFFGVILIIPIWLLMFNSRKESHREMLLMGVIFGLGGLVIGKYYAIVDYWNPPYVFGSNINIEDFLYGFILGGIISELYEFLLNKSNKKIKKHPITNKYIFILASLFSTILCFYFLVDIFRFNSIIAHIIPPLLIGTIITVFRKDLTNSTVMSGIITTIFVFIWFLIIRMIWGDIFSTYWYMKNLSGITFFEIPIEELIFAFSLGFGGSCFYEFIYNLKIKD